LRKQPYRVHTEIERDEGEPAVRKVADHPDAAPFLATIIERERVAESFYAGHAEVSTGALRGDAIEYAFLPYPTLEQQIDERIVAEKPDVGTDLIRSYLHFLESLPSRETVPREFLESIGAKPIPCLCFDAGPLDCTPRNILVDGDTWHVIDHEWMLEQPIPVELVGYVGVTSLVFGLQESILRHVGKERPVEIFMGRGRRFFAPVRWLDILGDFRLEIGLLNDWYGRFQKKVLLDVPPRRLRRRGHPYIRIPGRLHPIALASDLKALLRLAR
jgi:hypothetical protein